MKIQNGLHQCLHFNSRPHGGRPRRCGGRHNRRYFNSRPHGGRHTSKELAPRRMVFQLTPSRRATEAGGIFVLIFKISTHALTEGDDGVIQFFHVLFHFNSRPHGGRRASHISLRDCADYFNSRPHGGRQEIFPASTQEMTFQLTPSRRATRAGQAFHRLSLFQLTPSRRATIAFNSSMISGVISTHALTEGDGREY